MKKFDISTDSTCDLYKSEIVENGIYFLPLKFTLEKNGDITEYADEFSDMSEYKEYYKTLRSGVLSRTSMNNPDVHYVHFKKMAEAGVKTAIHFTISYGLCRTVDVARDAVKEVKKEFPDFRCLCVECSTTTIGQGMLVWIALDMQKKGKTVEETFDYVEKIKHNIQHFVVADDLSYLVRGGRLSAAKATIGSILNVKPIIVFNKEGKLVNYRKEKGMRKTLKSIADEFAKYSLNKDYPEIYIGHTDNEEAAEMLKDILHEKYGLTPIVRMIGPVIGSHLGPGTVAYIFLSNEERPL